MAINELVVLEFLLNNIGKIELNNIGLVNEIGASMTKGYKKLTTTSQIKKSNVSFKTKTNFYINGIGVTVKLRGKAFAIRNQITREDLHNILDEVNSEDNQVTLKNIDLEICKYHYGKNVAPRRPWHDFFSLEVFRKIIYFLLTETTDYGLRNLILEAPSAVTSVQEITTYTIDDYFRENLNKFYITMNKHWIGETDLRGHMKATGIAKRPLNKQWVFDNGADVPNSGWLKDIPEKERKTVYIISIDKI